jgi:hypothetical protein
LVDKAKSILKAMTDEGSRQIISDIIRPIIRGVVVEELEPFKKNVAEEFESVKKSIEDVKMDVAYIKGNLEGENRAYHGFHAMMEASILSRTENREVK